MGLHGLWLAVLFVLGALLGVRVAEGRGLRGPPGSPMACWEAF